MKRGRSHSVTILKAHANERRSGGIHIRNSKRKEKEGCTIMRSIPNIAGRGPYVIYEGDLFTRNNCEAKWDYLK